MSIVVAGQTGWSRAAGVLTLAHRRAYHPTTLARGSLQTAAAMQGVMRKPAKIEQPLMYMYVQPKIEIEGPRHMDTLVSRVVSEYRVQRERRASWLSIGVFN